MSDVRKALDELKAVMFAPLTTEERAILHNPYHGYTMSQLTEIAEEIANEFDKLPPYAIDKLKVLTDELDQVSNAINSIIDHLDGGTSDVPGR